MSGSQDLDAIVFMKVGRHAGETFEDIIKRKRREYAAAGRIFWGYGGGTMHPVYKVQPFASMKIKEGKHITLVMQEIISNHPDTEVYATEFSRDGETWEPVPEGIKVRGSRYALVLDEIEDGDLNIDLADYRVGVGPSEGKVASEYVKGRVDKGCLDRTGPPNTNEVSSKIVQATYFAHLREPYAVLLRSGKGPDEET
jgi:hypothetical protein